LQTVARRYASALADVVIERKEEREVKQEIDQWASMIEANPQLKVVFANPTIGYEEKRKVLEELISRTRVRPTTASFLRVLLRNQRLSQLRDVAERFAHVLDERGGVVSASESRSGRDRTQRARYVRDRRNNHRWFGRPHRLNHIRRFGSESSRTLVRGTRG
jgi:hypothetical protein